MTRTKPRHFVEYAAARGALAFLSVLPLRWAIGAAHLLMRAVDRAVPRLRRVALRNLEVGMPELSEEQRQRIASGVFRSIARMMAYFAHLPRLKGNLAPVIHYEGFEHYKDGIDAGKGVLFATAHLGNWELSAFAHAVMAAPMNVLVRPLDNPLLNRFVEARRRLTGNRIVGKKDFARLLLKALHANEAVGILADQNAGLSDGVFVDFFGIPACAGTGLARIAAKSGARVIPGFALWLESKQTYVLRFYPPLAVTGDAATDTQTWHRLLETVIRQYPDQWLWIHRRWKTRPPGSPPIYGAP